MTISLTQARTRVRNFLDDAGSVRWSDDEVDAALLVAQAEVLSLVTGTGSKLFRATASISSTSAGVVSLTSIAPLKLVDISLVQGTVRSPVLPVSFADYGSAVSGVQTLSITYVARPTFPAAPANTFAWEAAGISRPTLDHLMCTIAASECKVKEGELNPALEQRKEELRIAAVSELDLPSWTVMSLAASRGYPTRSGSGLFYVVTAPDTLQLVQQ